MKSAVFFAAFSICSAMFAAYDPFDDCADVDLEIRVEDERGNPVGDASLVVAYQISSEKGEVDKGRTDVHGLYRTRGRCNSVVNVEASKPGFYVSRVRESVARDSMDWVLKTRRWTHTPLNLNLALKTVRNPVKLTVHSARFKPYPATNEVLKLDLEKMEWCPPYGQGRHDDMHLVFDGRRNPMEWLDFHEHLSISMPNCVDGFYRLKLEPQSRFPYAYVANANAAYEKCIAFRHQVKPDGVVESVRLSDDEYLVYRIRTRTNELGQVTGAHYGRIGEGLCQYIGLSLKSWFNQTENDVNLEDAGQR